MKNNENEEGVVTWSECKEHLWLVAATAVVVCSMFFILYLRTLRV